MTMIETSATPLISAFALKNGWSVHVNPLHGAEGIEIQKQSVSSDLVLSVGYFRGIEDITIYRRFDSKRDIWCRSRLWFVWGWLIRPRLKTNQYKALRKIPASEFQEEEFVEIVRSEFLTAVK